MTMRFAVFLTLLSFTLTATAQQAAPVAPLASSDWARVRALPVGSTIYVSAEKSHVKCTLSKDDDESLTCMKNNKQYVFQHGEVLTVKLQRRGRSTLIGIAPGGVMMAAGGIGVATENCSAPGSGLLCGLGPALLIVAGGLVVVIGGLIGVGTDFARSTVYRAKLVRP